MTIYTTHSPQKDNHKKGITVAIDGFSSSGKSTMAKRLAKAVGYRYVDSGAMYRAVTLAAIRQGLITPGADSGDFKADEIARLSENISIDFRIMPDGSQHTLLDGEDVEEEIRGMSVSSCVSPVAAIPAVRARLTRLQQGLGAKGSIVMDGRDIGTTVFPDAELKVYVSASPETRARRRWLELNEKGAGQSYETILANVRERDRIDMTRAASPLRKADGAVELDNSKMSVEDQDRWLRNEFDKCLALKTNMDV